MLSVATRNPTKLFENIFKTLNYVLDDGKVSNLLFTDCNVAKRSQDCSARLHRANSCPPNALLSTAFGRLFIFPTGPVCPINCRSVLRDDKQYDRRTGVLTVAAIKLRCCSKWHCATTDGSLMSEMKLYELFGRLQCQWTNLQCSQHFKTTRSCG